MIRANYVTNLDNGKSQWFDVTTNFSVQGIGTNKDVAKSKDALIVQFHENADLALKVGKIIFHLQGFRAQSPEPRMEASGKAYIWYTEEDITIDQMKSDESHDSIPEKFAVPQDVFLHSDWWLCPQDTMRGHLEGVFCFGYRIGWTDDKWTVRINQFKTGKPLATIRKAEATLRTAAPSLFQRIDIDPGDTVVIPALNSKQTAGSADSKNSRLAKAIANGAEAKFVFDCLQKNKHKPLHRQPDADARDQVLNDANYRASVLNCTNILIVDDIVTRGATMSYIAAAIRQSNPSAQIFGFALGRHVRPENFPLQANAKIPHELAEIWDRT